MGVFSVPVTIGVDEEKIAQSIEKNVESQVINRVLTEVKKILYKNRPYSYTDDYSDPAPMKEMIKDEIGKIVEERSDEIVALAAEALADKLSRSKTIKEKIASKV